MPILTAATAEFFDTATHVVSTEVEIAATPEETWAVLNDHVSWMEWFSGMKAVEAQPAAWTSPGDTRQVTVNNMLVSEQAIIVEPGADLAFTILQWPLPIASRAAERVQLVDTSRQGEDRVNVIYTGAFDLTLIGRLSWPIAQRQFVAAWGGAFESLHEAVAARRG